MWLVHAKTIEISEKIAIPNVNSELVILSHPATGVAAFFHVMVHDQDESMIYILGLTSLNAKVVKRSEQLARL